MVIKDKVYSDFEVVSPIALELIGTQAFQRLKGVSQFGIPSEYYHLEGYSRYDHSLGVYILLNKLGASEREQISGLLHDVSHTAFSHLIDWVIGDSIKEDYQDRRHLSVLEGKEIADILDKFGFSSEQMADYHEFGLLEKEIPDLCVDRVDYALREFPPASVGECLASLAVFNGEVVFATKRGALLFADNFLLRQAVHWGGYEAMTRYVLLSGLLRRAIKDDVLSLEDLLQTDEYVVNKLYSLNRRQYSEVLELLKKKKLDFLPRSDTASKKKFRYVDPKVLVDGKLVRLSELSNEFKEKLEAARLSNEKGVYTGFFQADI